MKKNVFLFFTILFSIAVNAQRSSRYFVEIKGGLSLPVGDFANKNYGGGYLDNADGLAKTGWTAGFMAGYQVKKSLSAIISFGYSKNKQDADSYDAYLKNALGSNTSTSVITNSWDVFKVMGGGYVETPFSPASKFLFRANIQTGVCKTSIPGFRYTYYTGPPPTGQAGGVMYAKISLPWAFCYTLGAGVKYKLNHSIYLLADGVYFNSSPAYKYSYNPTFPIPGQPVAGKKKMSLSSVQVIAGIGVSF